MIDRDGNPDYFYGREGMIDRDGDPNYFYGVAYYGRSDDGDIYWFETKAEAMDDAECADQKYLPAELVLMKRGPVERSGISYTFDLDWNLEWGKSV